MTERLPFEPSRMKGPDPARPADRPLSVSDLASRIDGALRAGVPGRVRVLGEVSGFSDRTHWYFVLKDEQAVVNAVMFASAARRSPVRPENGLSVVAGGRIEYYAPLGRVSFVVERLELVGEGALEQRFRALCAELRGLGWFDPERKRALPAFPRRIAVVTSRTGAALQDVIDTMRRRCPAVGLLVVDVMVQGERAASDVANALRRLGERHEELGIDAILITRGGGSLEDLWAFNERAVAEAIRACPVPVVAAIGHETDTTVAELVADERAATPTQAAMRLTPDREALAQQLGSLSRRLRHAVRSRLGAESSRVRALVTRRMFVEPSAVLVPQRERLGRTGRALRGAADTVIGRERARVSVFAERLARRRPMVMHARGLERTARAAERLRAAAHGRLGSSRSGLEIVERHLRAIGPLRVLDRGYSCTLDAEGRLVRSVGEVRGGDRVTTRLADGSFESIVSTGPGPPTKPEPRSRDGARAARPDQMDLFSGPG